MIYQTRLTRSGRSGLEGGVLIPHSRSFFKDNPASRTKQCFLFPLPHPMPRIQPIPLPESGQIPYPVKKCCVFPNPSLYFNQIPDPQNTLPDPGPRLAGSHILDLYGNRFALFISGIMFYSFIEVKEGSPKECFLRQLNQW